MAETDNMRLWSALGKTDPAHTKQFTRSGGFKGTAIKPMWANKQMTEHFGPCGIGWGPDKPEYQIVPAADETLVFCTVGLWYIDGDNRAQVYGVGGDKVVIKGKDGLRTSDEAFKAAYTDAISNAMKFIGVAADVHMGLFEDSKYVQSVREEFKSQGEPKAEKPSPEKKTFGFIPPDKLQCIVLAVNALETKSENPRKYMQVVFNGRHEGFNYATSFDTKFNDCLLSAVNKEVVLQIKKGKFINVEDVLIVDGVEYADGKPSHQAEEANESL